MLRTSSEAGVPSSLSSFQSPTHALSTAIDGPRANFDPKQPATISAAPTSVSSRPGRRDRDANAFIARAPFDLLGYTNLTEARKSSPTSPRRLSDIERRVLHRLASN